MLSNYIILLPVNYTVFMPLMFWLVIFYVMCKFNSVM